jgi:small GTP-binding protein
LGDSNVGKTNFMTRYTNDSYNQMFFSTIGLNSEMKFLKINGRINVLTLWDTAGQERFKSMPKKYYRTANGVLLLFDINDRNSFNEVNEWMKQIKENTIKSDENDNENDNENKENGVVIYLLGNKIDMMQDNEGAVTREEIDDLVDKLNIKYYDICCRWNLNIEEIMARISLDIYKKKIPSSKIIKLSKTKNANNKKGCCQGQKEPKEKNIKAIK